MHDSYSPLGVGAIILAIILFFVFILFAPFGCTQLEERQVAVPLWNGEISGPTKTAGLHWYNPVWGDMEVYDVGFVELNGGKMKVYEAKSERMQDLRPPVGLTHRLNPEYVTIVHRQVGKNYATTLVEQFLIASLTQRAVEYDFWELHANRDAVALMVQWDIQRELNSTLPNNLMSPNKPIATRKQEVPVFSVKAEIIEDGYNIERSQETGQEVRIPINREQRRIVVTFEEKEVPIPVIEIQKLVIADWGFSQLIRNRIDAKQEAIQIAEQRRNEVEQERANADKAIQRARGEAESRRLSAEADAYQRRQRAEAEAQAITAIASAEAAALERMGKALRENPQALTARWIERWNGQVPTVLGGGGSGDNLSFLMPVPVQPRSERTEDEGSSNNR